MRLRRRCDAEDSNIMSRPAEDGKRRIYYRVGKAGRILFVPKERTDVDRAQYEVVRFIHNTLLSDLYLTPATLRYI